MKIIVDNLAVEYADEGTGPVILMLHGWKDDLHTFDDLAPLLSGSWRIIRLDLPGFGQSETPQNMQWNLGDYACFVKDFIHKLGLDVDVLLGHSFGGRIVIKMSATNILHARKNILIASAGIAKRRTWRNSILTVMAKIGRIATDLPPFRRWKHELRRGIYKKLGSDYFGAGTLKDTFLNIIKEDLSSAASAMTTPTLLIWGQHDTQTPLSDATRLSQLIRNARLKIINGAGHFVHKEDPHGVAALIREFLS